MDGPLSMYDLDGLREYMANKTVNRKWSSSTFFRPKIRPWTLQNIFWKGCLLYTSDAADE